ncbi:MAG: DUF4880 domain-containing protein [Proteobacteria bacterium]|nr:DUF4880 domain-containing protein [Pseudomonadota bacterium]
MSYTEAERLEAAQWFLDVHDTENPSPELLQEWLHWMEASEGHRCAFAAVESAWRQLPPNSLRDTHWSAHPSAEEDDYDGSVSIDVWLAARPRAAPPQAASSSRHSRPAWRSKPLRLAAAAAVAAIAIGLAVRNFSALRPGSVPESFATRTGQQMQITLPDGSQVTLGARSRLTVAYTAQARNLRLEQGEAFFSVQKNHAWPFRVRVLDDVVTAVGTQFDVRAIDHRIDVSVAEGIVQVNADTPFASAMASRAAGKLPPSGLMLAHVIRGESLSFLSRRGGRVLASAIVTRIDPSHAAQWRDGWLIYRNEPLRDVLTDVARYSDRKIVVTHPAAITQRFTGAVYKDSIAEWLQSLPSAFPVSITVRGSQFVVAPAHGSAASSN